MAKRTIQSTAEVPVHANEQQIGGEHYKAAAIEHWDLVTLLELDYFQAQITRYLLRWKTKNGVEDLLKAQHYLAKYIEIAEFDGAPKDYVVAEVLRTLSKK